MSEIILLDGTSWEKSVLLEAMMDDDFYYGYLGSASLSSSSDKLLNESPKEYKNMLEGARLDTPALAIGKLIHTAVLEPEKVDALFVKVDVASKASKIYKDAKEQLLKGQTILTTSEYDLSMGVVEVLLRNELVKDMLKGGEFEMPAIGDVSGLPHRAKADILHRGVAVYDLKTTSDIGSGNDTPDLVIRYPHDADHISISRSSYPHDLHHITRCPFCPTYIRAQPALRKDHKKGGSDSLI